MILQIQVESVSTRKDRTYKLVLGTQELSPKDATELFTLNNSLAYCYISAKRIESDVMHEIDKASIEIVDTIKSPSKRLKSVFYLLWKQDNEGYEDSELYYLNKMEKVIEFYKEKLDDGN